MKTSIIYSIVTVFLIVSATYGCLIFTDNFDQEQIGLSQTLDNWRVTNGSVDVIGSGTSVPFSEFFSGNYLDLDGSSWNAGKIESNMRFEAGIYELTFKLAGSQRTGMDTVDIYFGSITIPLANYVFNAADAGTIITINTTINDSTRLIFDHHGGDNIGILLDNVSISLISDSDVPEPSVISLFILGLTSLLGFSVKRKN